MSLRRVRPPSTGRVPYLHEKQIERDTEGLLAEEAERVGTRVTFPVPVEELVELNLDLDFAIEDLSETFGGRGVLGAIWFTKPRIRIDASLDPDQHPGKLGRYRFTIAHEIGHWRLHRAHLAANPNAKRLFTDEGKPAFVCRDAVKPREEIQADMYAAALLMPRQMTVDAWLAWRGTDEAAVIPELAAAAGASEPDETDAAVATFIRPLAEQLEVSMQALRFRLEHLGLLTSQRTNLLF